MKKSAATRLNILQKAFELVYVNGYQATSVDDIIANTQVTKGAFFYHFKNKEEMGLAMINEVMNPNMQDSMTSVLAQADNPVEALYQMMHDLLIANPFMQVQYGCPAHNLIQEMSPLNEAFKYRLEEIVNEWQIAIETCIENGKEKRKIRNEVDAHQVAVFIMAGYGGIRNIGKVHNDTAYYQIFLQEYRRYLEGLQ